MKRIYIYGVGKGKTVFARCLKKESVQVIAAVDNYAKCDYEYEVIHSSKIENNFDFIVITVMEYNEIKESLVKSGVLNDKIVCFFSPKDVEREEVWEFIDVYKWRNEIIWKDYKERIKPFYDNVYYEVNAHELKYKGELPNIISNEITIDMIVNEHKSLSRFGDGEFEIILGRNRAKFQSYDDGLKDRLLEVLNSNDERLLIAIADNYGSLVDYTEEAATSIRYYLSNGVRQEHMMLLDMHRNYHNAYLSRPYIIYRNKEKMLDIFNKLRKIWECQNVLIVEGENTRFGVGNDLLDNATSVERILTLDRNCFNVYENLLRRVREAGKNRLILISLGPVATIMAYDLALTGYWAIDIGQLDVEYEWFLRKTQKRCNIPYKTVSEVVQNNGIEESLTTEALMQYKNEIVGVEKN